ncbi:zinc-binding alcohol dehydrogenase family protein [Pediococcus damnosus]|uniref:Zinc-type alcohol dehydrogenase-like protein n=1 Tax=Pediococcus damnosus TaxID=51663 RepID=A0AAC9B0Z4_9LACO|nr:zinc-binding alcohol dehydrogenase family protein [Pediococcus damnosus]AMV61230.1 Bifunctional protein: zinc-containing alcohol dehydrogenase [Pediococcus damnosus]AMV62451.1 Bifunctional protein: zinc-containing alcohol dehydrogenase [Pediococcus damnosus]AMV65590.1 Bifunctional protein: zinc-containing alcohol dehydrogenase [Pediococcus damnosus]AMV68989.1 Bifunctional protein: zinc-containing alcohol dehydrogenase [Pediococcus damnosus]KJU74425.1 NADPH:quinone reductase [Pediococcus dam
MNEQVQAIGFYKGLPIEDASSLIDLKVARQTAAGYDLLIKVKAVSVNPVDTKTRQSHPETEIPTILGFDACGIVEEVGDLVKGFSVGDSVFYAGTNQRPGSDQAYQLVDSRLVAQAPKKISIEEAAAMPLTSLTAWESLFERMPLVAKKDANTGQKILIINGAGGVGSIAIQLAKWAGLTVITTASRPETVEWVKKMGADVVLDYHHSLEAQLKEQKIQNIKFGVIFQSTDAYLPKLAKLIAPEGYITSIVENEKPLPMGGLLKAKSITFAWEFMFTKSIYQTEDMASQGEILSQVADLLDQKELQSTLTLTLNTINAQNLRRAHELVESNKMIGKLVITGDFNAK